LGFGAGRGGRRRGELPDISGGRYPSFIHRERGGEKKGKKEGVFCDRGEGREEGGDALSAFF